MGHIVAIGGGDIRIAETLPIDREIIKLTGKKSPRVLFIPTASNDSPEYIEAFIRLYRDKLTCKVDTLLLSKDPLKPLIREKILGSDAIYVGGGNTMKMIRIWRSTGVDELLKEAYTKNIVLSGTSAGAICWFKYGHSDSRRYTNPDNWQYIRVSGLGILPFILCPHYHVENREKSFSEMIHTYGMTGIAVDNGAAVVSDGQKFRVIHALPAAKAYIVFKKANTIHTQEIRESARLQLLGL